MPFLLRLLINAAALWVSTNVVTGISHQGRWMSLFLVALVFGVLNASVRPVLKLLTFPLLILTLGLFTFVINAVMLLITGWFSERLGLGFHVAGFWPAFWGGLVISIVSLAMSLLVKSHQRSERESW
jgi:putative membrane protein